MSPTTIFTLRDDGCGRADMRVWTSAVGEVYPGYGTGVGTGRGYTGYHPRTHPRTHIDLFLRLRPYPRPNEGISEVS